MKAAGVRLDWSVKHPPLWAVINITLVLVAAAAATHHLSFGWMSMALVGVAVAFVAMVTVVAGLLTGRKPIKALGLGALLFAGGIWVLVGRVSPWQPATLGPLVVAAVSAGAVVLVVGRRDRNKAQAAGLEAVRQVFASAAAGLAREWMERIERVAHIKGQVLRNEAWPGKTGFTMTFQPVAGGTTVRDLATAAARLAADAHLPVGCGVEVGPGDHRGQMVLRVSTVNALKQVRPYPMPAHPTTINNPVPIGVHRDTSESSISLRYHSGVLVGAVGSGKTNRLHVITAGLAFCTDVLVWQIDLTGGLSAPWINPWLEGRVAAPGVDWAASNIEEAAAMLRALIAVINGRKPAYRKRMRAANDDKVPVGPDLPQIILMVDEFATLPGQLQTDLTTISDTGRSVGVRTMVCALRATMDYLPSSVKAQADERIGQRMTSEAEMAYLFGWADNVSPADAPNPGNGFVQGIASETARPDMAYRMSPHMVDEVLARTAGHRPRLDDISVALADEGERLYAERWVRHRAAAAAAESTSPGASVGASPRVRRFEAEAADRRTNRQSWEDRLPAASTRAGFDVTDPASWPTPKGVSYPRSPAHEALLDLLRDALPQGLSPQALVKALIDAGHAPERQTVQKWLGVEVSRGTVKQPVDRGPYYFVVQDEPVRAAITAGAETTGGAS